MYEFQVSSDAGKGYLVAISSIKSPNVFRIEQPLLGKTESEGLKRDTFIGDGKRYTHLTEDPPRAAPKVEDSTKPFERRVIPNILDGWFRGCVGALFSAIGTNETPLTDLVKAANRAPGYEIHSDVRYVDVADRHKNIVKVKHYRIFIGKKVGSGAKASWTYNEIVIDGSYYLPLVLNNKKKDGKVIQMTRMWRTGWDRNPKQKFGPDMYDPKVLRFDFNKT